MTKYDLEGTLSKLNICMVLLSQHIPEIYAREALKEVSKSIEAVKKDIKEA